MKKSYLVEFNIKKKKTRFVAYEKFYWIIFLEKFIFEVPS